MLFSIPVVIVVDAASPRAAQQQATAAQKLLNEPMYKTIISSQGLHIKGAKVGAPTAGG